MSHLFFLSDYPPSPVNVSITVNDGRLFLTWQNSDETSESKIQSYKVAMACTFTVHSNDESILRRKRAQSATVDGNRHHYEASLKQLDCYQFQKFKSLVSVHVNVTAVEAGGRQSQPAVAQFLMSK